MKQSTLIDDSASGVELVGKSQGVASCGITLNGVNVKESFGKALRRSTKFLHKSVFITMIAASVSAETLQYVGSTSELTTPGVGLFTLNKMCADTFVGSQLCSSSDLLLSGETTIEERGFAWVAPTLAGTPLNSSGRIVAIDVTGASASETLNCVGWSTISGAFESMTVTGTGQFKPEPCDNEGLVACCGVTDEKGNGE